MLHRTRVPRVRPLPTVTVELDPNCARIRVFDGVILQLDPNGRPLAIENAPHEWCSFLL